MIKVTGRCATDAKMNLGGSGVTYYNFLFIYRAPPKKDKEGNQIDGTEMRFSVTTFLDEDKIAAVKAGQLVTISGHLDRAPYESKNTRTGNNELVFPFVANAIEAYTPARKAA